MKYQVLLLILFSFLFFSQALNFYFVTDDFFYISFNSLKETISLHYGLYHYNPVFWALMYLIKKFFGENPFPFHLLAIMLHLFNIYLVFILSGKLLKKKVNVFLAVMLFSFFFSNYEVVYWITGINTSLMVFFYLLAFLSLPNYLLFTVFFVLSLLSHEYAVSLPFVGVSYLLIFPVKNKKRLAPYFLFPFTAIFFLFLLKTLFSAAPLFVTIPPLIRMLQSVVKSTLYVFLPLPNLIDSLPKLFLPPVFLIIILLLISKAKGDKVKLFLLSWTLITIVFFSATSLPQARYFYLTAIPALLLLSSIGRRLTLLYLTILIIGNIIFLNLQMTYWGKSSKIIKNTISYVKNNRPDSNSELYFLNLPDSLNGPPWNAYLFRSGLDRALNTESEKIHYARTLPLNNIIRDDPFIGKEDLEKLKNNGAIIYQYNYETVSVIRL